MKVEDGGGGCLSQESCSFRLRCSNFCQCFCQCGCFAALITFEHHILTFIRSRFIMTSINGSGDVEKDAGNSNYAHLTNETLHNFSWKDVTVSVKDRSTKQPLDILSGVSGLVKAGTLSLHHHEQHSG